MLNILMMTVGNLSDLFLVIKGTVRLILPGDQNKQLFNFLQEKPNFSGRGGGDGSRRGIYLYCIVKDSNYTSVNNAQLPPPPIKLHLSNKSKL
jgi:hypothetical protein